MSQVDIQGKWTFDVMADCKDSSVDLAQEQELQFGKEKAILKECSISPMGYYLEVTSQEKFNGNKIIKGVEENASLYLKMEIKLHSTEAAHRCFIRMGHGLLK